MGTSADQIEVEIKDERSRLGWDISELQHRLKDVVNWRGHFEKRPLAMIGGALAAGFLIASMVKSRRRGWEESEGGRGFLAPEYASELHKVRRAFVSASIDRMEKFLGDAMPGFSERLRMERETTSGASPITPERRVA